MGADNLQLFCALGVSSYTYSRLPRELIFVCETVRDGVGPGRENCGARVAARKYPGQFGCRGDGQKD